MNNVDKIKQLQKQIVEKNKEILFLQKQQDEEAKQSIDKIPEKILDGLYDRYENLLYSKVKLKIPAELHIYFFDEGKKLIIDSFDMEEDDFDYNKFNEVKVIKKQKQKDLTKLLADCKKIAKQYKVKVSDIYKKIGIFDEYD